MSFTGTFTKADSSAGYNAFTITDTSSYTDEPKNTFSTRRIYLILADGSYIEDDTTGNDYFDFGFADYPTDEITLNVLTADCAISVYVHWVSLNPQVNSTYSAEAVYDFKDYINAYKYSLILQLAGNPGQISIQNFADYLDLIQTLIDSSATCITFTDQLGSQNCIDQATELMNNPNLSY